MPQPEGEKDGFEVWLIDATWTAIGITKIWPKIEDILTSGAKAWADWTTIEEMRKEFINGKIQVWFVTSPERKSLVAVATTQLLDYPRGRGIEYIVLVGKQRKDWLELIDQTILSAAQKRWGVEFVQLVGRVGWERELTKLGYEKKRVQLVKTLKT